MRRRMLRRVATTAPTARLTRVPHVQLKCQWLGHFQWHLARQPQPQPESESESESASASCHAYGQPGRAARRAGRQAAHSTASWTRVCVLWQGCIASKITSYQSWNWRTTHVELLHLAALLLTTPWLTRSYQRAPRWLSQNARAENESKNSAKSKQRLRLSWRLSWSWGRDWRCRRCCCYRWLCLCLCLCLLLLVGCARIVM